VAKKKKVYNIDTRSTQASKGRQQRRRKRASIKCPRRRKFKVRWLVSPKEAAFIRFSLFSYSFP